MINLTSTDVSAAQPAGKLAYKAAEAAELLSISERSLWTLTNEGKIRSIKIGRSVRYCHAELVRFLNCELQRGGELD